MANKSTDESPYTKDGLDGKPVGPEHDGSFHPADFYDVETGERIATDWDTPVVEAAPQKAAPKAADK